MLVALFRSLSAVLLIKKNSVKYAAAICGSVVSNAIKMQRSKRCKTAVFKGQWHETEKGMVLRRLCHDTEKCMLLKRQCNECIGPSGSKVTKKTVNQVFILPCSTFDPVCLCKK